MGYATSFKLKDDLCITNAHNVVFKNESNKYEPYKYIEGKIYNSNEKLSLKLIRFLMKMIMQKYHLLKIVSYFLIPENVCHTIWQMNTQLEKNAIA